MVSEGKWLRVQLVGLIALLFALAVILPFLDIPGWRSGATYVMAIFSLLFAIVALVLYREECQKKPEESRVWHFAFAALLLACAVLAFTWTDSPVFYKLGIAALYLLPAIVVLWYRLYFVRRL